MFMQRISILLALIFLALFAFSFGAIPDDENYTGLTLYHSDFMIAARWYFLWVGISIIASLFFIVFCRKK